MQKLFRALFFSSIFALMFSLVGCEKAEEEREGLIEIFAESMGGSNGKVLLDGARSTWVDGDSIRINGDKVVVERINGHAYISYATPQAVNRAVYPASLASGDLTTDNVTLNFPAYYHYRADANGHQLLDLPMAARSENGEALEFKHLTGALYITITNNATESLTLQSVTVSSNVYQLSGSRTINFSNLESIEPIRIPASETIRTVTLLFDTGYTLAADASVKVMLPVMPVGGSGNNLFTIKVNSFNEGRTASYLYSGTQASGIDHTLGRNQLGYAPVALTASGSAATLDQVGTNHYVVRTPLEFLQMVQSISNQTVDNQSTFDILEDLDMTGFAISPIQNNLFSGTIDGKNHTISNLTINSVTKSRTCYCALFHQAGSSLMLTNLHFDGLNLFAHNVGSFPLYMAGLIADNETSGTTRISNCSVSIDSVNTGGATGNIFYGGLFGYISVATNITNCHVTTSSQIIISGNNIWGGGLMGYTGSYTTEIISSSWCGAMNFMANTNAYAGGFIGQKSGKQFTLTNCSVTGSISVVDRGTYPSLGALIGRFGTPRNPTITNLTKNITLTLNGNTIISDYGN